VEAMGDQIPDGNEVGGEFLSRSLQEIQRINDLVSDIVSFGKPSQIETEPTDLKALVRDAAALISSRARKSQVRLEVHDSDPIPNLLLDGNKIKQVLLNLIVNGIEAMEQGGTLRVRLQTLKKWVQITVEDEGKGIPPRIVEDVFNPFFSTKKEGSGLGLHISRQIIESHEGTLALKSPGGRGTRVTISLPLQEEGVEEP
jgi:signal transduction histidine kinase